MKTVKFPLQIIEREVRYIERYERIRIVGPATLSEVLQDSEEFSRRREEYFQIRKEILAEQNVRNSFKENFLNYMNRDFIYYNLPKLLSTQSSDSSTNSATNVQANQGTEITKESTKTNNDVQNFLKRNIPPFLIGTVAGAGAYHLVMKYNKNSEKKLVENIVKKIQERVVKNEADVGSI